MAKKLILENYMSPGDVIMLTAAVRDLCLTYPGEFEVKIKTACGPLWENNPYLSNFCDCEPDITTIRCEYPLIHRSNHLPYHFIHGFRLFLNEKLGLNIQPHAFKGDIHLSDLEKSWMSQVEEITGVLPTKFWIVVSGGKTDFTAKWPDPDKLQEVVDRFRGEIQFVQCGEAGPNHVHPPLDGVINLVGRTDLRQMVRLMYHASGVVCPVTMFMHLAAAVETKRGEPLNRPCVVLAGGREPVQWEAYPHHQFLHTAGALPCCDNGGCWKSRVVPVEDGSEQNNSLCERPVRMATGRWIPQCQEMILSYHIVSAIDRYSRFTTAASNCQEVTANILPVLASAKIGEGIADIVPGFEHEVAR